MNGGEIPRNARIPKWLDRSFDVVFAIGALVAVLLVLTHHAAAAPLAFGVVALVYFATERTIWIVQTRSKVTSYRDVLRLWRRLPRRSLVWAGPGPVLAVFTVLFLGAAALGSAIIPTWPVAVRGAAVLLLVVAMGLVVYLQVLYVRRPVEPRQSRSAGDQLL